MPWRLGHHPLGWANSYYWLSRLKFKISRLQNVGIRYQYTTLLLLQNYAAD